MTFWSLKHLAVWISLYWCTATLAFLFNYKKTIKYHLQLSYVRKGNVSIRSIHIFIDLKRVQVLACQLWTLSWVDINFHQVYKNHAWTSLNGHNYILFPGNQRIVGKIACSSDSMKRFTLKSWNRRKRSLMLATTILRFYFCVYKKSLSTHSKFIVSMYVLVS